MNGHNLFMFKSLNNIGYKHRKVNYTDNLIGLGVAGIIRRQLNLFDHI